VPLPYALFISPFQHFNQDVNHSIPFKHHHLSPNFHLSVFVGVNNSVSNEHAKYTNIPGNANNVGNTSILVPQMASIAPRSDTEALIKST
jgi:hypothetical protein